MLSIDDLAQTLIVVGIILLLYTLESGDCCLVAGLALLFIVVFALCCPALIPFFIDDLKDVYHISPTDGTVVGVYKRLKKLRW